MGRAFSPYSYADSYPGRCRISCFAGNPALAWAGIASRLWRLVLWRNQPLIWATVISIVRLALMGREAWNPIWIGLTLCPLPLECSGAESRRPLSRNFLHSRCYISFIFIHLLQNGALEGKVLAPCSRLGSAPFAPQEYTRTSAFCHPRLCSTSPPDENLCYVTVVMEPL